MKRLFTALIALIIVLHYSVSGQNRTDSFFKNGQVLNFIGNSITHGTANTGRFHNYVLLYCATRFPDEKVVFRNSGIWGDNANSFLRRMDDDILQHPANFSIVMAGMNDVNRSLYDPVKQSEPDIETRKSRALSDYKGYLENVILRLRQAGTTVILQKPSIYDQTGNLSAANMPGVNDALQKCTVIMDELAQKYSIQTVDYWSILNNINQQLQAVNPAATIISNDRIHPASPGNFVMAYQFLKSLNSPKYIANVEINGNTIVSSLHCTVSDLEAGSGTLSFMYKPQSLPFPVAADAEPALALVPFQDELNSEMLKVASLPEGRYALTVDNSFIANFTAQDLAKGINLSMFSNTPQYRQALKVKEKCDAYRDLQVRLRDMKMIEINYLARELWTDFNAARTYIENLKNTGSPVYVSQKNRFDAYLLNKPMEEALEQELADLADLIFTINKPSTYSVTLSLTTQTHSWDFDHSVLNNQTDGWTIVNYSNAATSGGVLDLAASQTYCHIKYNVQAGSLDPMLSNQVVVRLKNTTENTKARFYWWGSAATAAFIEFDISANDTGFKEYTVDLSKDSRWWGDISLIRFDVPSPVTASSLGKTVSIDYIKFKTAGAGTLPVSLTAFSGKYQNDAVELRWTTVSEHNNSHFNILCSNEEGSYHTIGRVNAREGSGSIKNYSFTDRMPSTGLNYYQLEQVDYDGKAVRYPPVIVECLLKGEKIRAFVNGKRMLCLQLNSVRRDYFELALCDLSGRRVNSFRDALLPGANSFEYPVGHLPPGLYVLRFSSSAGSLGSRVYLP